MEVQVFQSCLLVWRFGLTYLCCVIIFIYSEEKLQSWLKLRNFQNPFNKDKTVGHKKGLKFALVVELYHSTKIAKAGPGFDEIP